ncbi:MAG TPA: NAD(P)H-dependent oxidoreductase subunit E [Candidatus Binataceae bacterium]|nr:NAD(P)H-dependent oxidoreductase subunit E [Candidatus Binataceae bacterium]
MTEHKEINFSQPVLAELHDLLSHYPTKQAALLPALWLAQREFGWISPEVEAYVAGLLGLAPSHVAGVVSFYTMFYRKPVGRWHLEVCGNLSCRLRGAATIIDCVRDKLAIGPGETTADGKFTLSEVECLASCGSAPMLQLNHGPFYENLTPESVVRLIDELGSRGD